MRRWVAMALDDLPVDLVECPTVSAAMDALDAGPVQLIITDLMMPVESGFDLLRRLRESPSPSARAPVVVLSAGLTEPVRKQLALEQVWRLLAKPVGLTELQECVRDALARTPAPASGPAAPGQASAGAAEDGVELAIRNYFEGDRELFDAYRAACLTQFPDDIRDGDTASAAADLPSLRRVAHSLKSVLLTLGHPALSALARELEETSHAGVLAPAQVRWAGLRSELQTFLTAG